jgi:hypothetical protein
LLSIDNEEWLVKFRSSFDPKDISMPEFAVKAGVSKLQTINIEKALRLIHKNMVPF